MSKFAFEQQSPAAHEEAMRHARVPLTRLFATAIAGILLLFVLVIVHGYLRLVEFRDLLDGITERSVPSLAIANRVHSNVNTLTYLTERLAQSGSEAARRVSFNQINRQLSELQNINANKEADPYFKRQLDALSDELEELNVLVAHKLRTTATQQSGLSNMYQLYDDVALLSENEAIRHSNPQGAEWLLSLADIVALAAEASDANRLYRVRELGIQIAAKLRQLEGQLVILSRENREEGREVIDRIRSITLGEQGIVLNRIELLRIDGRTRGRGNFVRNLILDHAGLAEFESESLNTQVVNNAMEISQDVAMQTRLMGGASLVFLLMFLVVMYFLHVRLVGRLQKLNENVKLLEQGKTTEIDVTGNDEITDLASTFKTFARTVEAQKKTLHDLSLSDGLTGIANRRAFDLRLEQEIDSARRHQWPLTVVLLDVDFFKPYNDQYGHAKGDDCLLKIATALSGQMRRKNDFVARYGGEEFACILPDTPLEGAARIADQILKAVRSLAIKHDYSQADEYITVSVGFTCRFIQAENAQTPRNFLKEADEALYRAKQKGRNQWEHFKDA